MMNDDDVITLRLSAKQLRNLISCVEAALMEFGDDGTNDRALLDHLRGAEDEAINKKAPRPTR